MHRRRAAVVCCLLVAVGLAGCSSLFGADTPQETLTPVQLDEDEAPAPTVTATATATPTVSPPTETATATAASVPPSAQSRYASLRPTCDRPPGLVVHIQVNALRYNDPQTDEGINATYRFASPRNRNVTGPVTDFASLIKSRYEPLLNAETVTYGPMSATNRTATQRITVRTPDGDTTSYIWELERQSGGRYDGCWLTSSVRLSAESVDSTS